MIHSDQKGFQSLMSIIHTQNSNSNPVLGEEDGVAKGGREMSSEIWNRGKLRTGLLINWPPNPETSRSVIRPYQKTTICKTSSFSTIFHFSLVLCRNAMIINIIWYHLYVGSKKMIQMNLFIKQKQTHRHRKYTYGYQRGKKVWDKFGTWD